MRRSTWRFNFHARSISSLSPPSCPFFQLEHHHQVNTTGLARHLEREREPELIVPRALRTAPVVLDLAFGISDREDQKCLPPQWPLLLILANNTTSRLLRASHPFLSQTKWCLRTFLPTIQHIIWSHLRPPSSFLSPLLSHYLVFNLNTSHFISLLQDRSCHLTSLNGRGSIPPYRKLCFPQLILSELPLCDQLLAVSVPFGPLSCSLLSLAFATVLLQQTVEVSLGFFSVLDIPPRVARCFRGRTEAFVNSPFRCPISRGVKLTLAT